LIHIKPAKKVELGNWKTIDPKSIHEVNRAEVDRILASYQKQLERFRADAAAAAKTIKGNEVSGVDAAEQAAWTLVANALLNLDEALTKE